MISFRESPDIEYNGTENCAVMKLFADTAAELTGVTHFDGILLLHGSSAYVIESGETYMLNGAGAWILQPSQNAFSNVYTKLEIDSMITEINGIIAYYHTTLVSDTGEITFYALAGYIGTWTIYGNGQQTGTPTVDNPIMPDFCGTLDGADWTIPITCAGQTTPVYLGEVPTVRKIRKLVLTGESNIRKNLPNNPNDYLYFLSGVQHEKTDCICSHLVSTNSFPLAVNGGVYSKYSSEILYINLSRSVMNAQPSGNTIEGFKEYLAAQYAAGTPVTVWYVLAEPDTGIVNEPLCKIGDYADELHSADAGVTIATVQGENTLTVDTILKPSRIEIHG